MPPKGNYVPTGYGRDDGSVIAVNGVLAVPPAPAIFSGGGTEPGPNRS